MASSAIPLKNILLVGAAGHLGPSILQAFASDTRFNLSILTRKSSTSSLPTGISVHQVGDNYAEADLLEAFTGKDAIISTIATAAVDIQKRMIDAAVKAGVRRFVPSEFGSDTRNEPGYRILPQYFAGKCETVDYLKGKEQEGLTWTAFVTGPFFELAMQGFMGFDLTNHRATIFGAGNDGWSTTTLSSIGLAVKNAMLLPAETANDYLYVSSFTVSQNDVVDTLEKIQGVTYTIERVDAEKQREEGMQKMANGDFSGVMQLIRYINCIAGHGGDYAKFRESSNGLLKLPEEHLETTLRRVVHD